MCYTNPAVIGATRVILRRIYFLTHIRSRFIVRMSFVNFMRNMRRMRSTREIDEVNAVAALYFLRNRQLIKTNNNPFTTGHVSFSINHMAHFRRTIVINSPTNGYTIDNVTTDCPMCESVPLPYEGLSYCLCPQGHWAIIDDIRLSFQHCN